MISARNQQLAAVVILAACLAILIFAVANSQTIAIDVALRNWSLSLNTPTTVLIWEDISVLGSVATLTGLTLAALALFAWQRDWQAVRQIAIAMGGAVGLDTFFKWAIHRPRPEEVYAHTLPSTYSFPSGHALFSLAFYISVAIIMGRRTPGNLAKGVWALALLLCALIGASRIFLGVHYGSDVLGGYLIATTWLMFLVATRLA